MRVPLLLDYRGSTREWQAVATAETGSGKRKQER